MSEQISFLLTVTCIVLGLFLLWAISIGITYWDASRRRLPAGEIVAWMLLVTLVPLVGFVAYLFSRLLAATLSPPHARVQPSKQRVTMLKNRPNPEPNTGTIPAADLLLSTVPEAIHLQANGQGVRYTPPRYMLTVVEGPHEGLKYLLNRLPMKMGRGPDVSISLDEDLGVSRQHAEIYEQAGVLRIRDLQSTHGTQVNGFSIDDKSLDPGDRIHIGGSTLTVGLQEVGH